MDELESTGSLTPSKTRSFFNRNLIMRTSTNGSFLRRVSKLKRKGAKIELIDSPVVTPCTTAEIDEPKALNNAGMNRNIGVMLLNSEERNGTGLGTGVKGVEGFMTRQEQSYKS